MSISLEKSIRTCKVDTGYADRIATERIQNPNLMVCPTWTGVDNAGRQVCADSFYTKRAGCNSALDRVSVENFQRPDYMEYLTLSANGIRGNLYGGTGNEMDSAIRNAGLENDRNVTGAWNAQLGGSVNFDPTCTARDSVLINQEGFRHSATNQRMLQSLNNGFQNNQFRNSSGF